jgi:hypothetical protein
MEFPSRCIRYRTPLPPSVRARCSRTARTLFPRDVGWPYVTAYQLAIKLRQRHPEAAEALNSEVGGRGTGVHTSLAQYLAHELSRRIKRARDAGETYRVEGAFLSNDGITELTYANPEGDRPVESSLTGSPKDLSLFRWRA